MNFSLSTTLAELIDPSTLHGHYCCFLENSAVLNLYFPFDHGVI